MTNDELKIYFMKYILSVCLLTALFSCEENYFKYKVEITRIADSCENKEVSLNITSNIDGRRYEFNKCLPDNYDERNCEVRRSHDSVFVRFKNVPVQSTTSKVTLDIDTWPIYNYITIDDVTFVVIGAGN